jgi:hypothetical protein
MSGRSGTGPNIPMAINPWDIFGVAVALMLLGIVLWYHPKPRKSS